jgi:hypothetical protein
MDFVPAAASGTQSSHLTLAYTLLASSGHCFERTFFSTHGARLVGIAKLQVCTHLLAHSPVRDSPSKSIGHLPRPTLLHTAAPRTSVNLGFIHKLQFTSN